MNDQRRQELFELVKGTHDYVLAALRHAYIGRAVRVKPPRWEQADHAGREAVIEGVIITDGVPVFLCMVTRAGTDPRDRDFLNSGGWTRSYRPWGEFEVIDDALPTVP